MQLADRHRQLLDYTTIDTVNNPAIELDDVLTAKLPGQPL
jgi:hypothetical protein